MVDPANNLYQISYTTVDSSWLLYPIIIIRYLTPPLLAATSLSFSSYPRSPISAISITMCGTQISYACATTLISQSITCGCSKIIACGKSTLYCGTCSHPRCKELRGEITVRV